jgi:hypothetical protein
MTTSPKFAGVGCHWGVSSTGLTGYGALVLTGTDQSMEADTETAQDATGYVVTDVTYNHRETATLETWISGSSGGNVVVASTSYPQPGDTVTITDSVNTGLAGSTWIAGGVSVRRSNTSLAKVSIPLRRYAKI